MRRSERILGISGRVVSAVLAVIAASPVIPAAKEPDAAEILRRAEEVRNADFEFSADILVRTASPRGRPPERVATFSMVASGKDRTLMLRRTPKILYGGTFLIADDKYWMLLPRSKSALELAEPQVVFGEISNADLARMNFLRGWAPRLLGEERFEEYLCYKLELSRTGEGGHYTRVLYWIRKKDFFPRRLECYGGTPTRRLKMLRYEDYQKGNLGVRPMKVIVEGGNPWEDISTVTFSNLRRIKADAVQFTLEGMITLRDAARAKQKATQSEDTPLEDILEAGAPKKP